MSKPGRRKTRPSSPRPCASGKAISAKDGEGSLRGDPLISAVDARSFLRRNGHGLRPPSVAARASFFPFPKPHPFPSALFQMGAGPCGGHPSLGDVCWYPLFHWNTTESCVERPGKKRGLRRLTPLSVSLMRPVHATGPVGSLFMAGASCAAMRCPSRSRASGYSVRICLPQIFHCRRMQKSGALLRGSRFFRQ